MSAGRVPKHKRRLATDIEEVQADGDKLKYKIKTNDANKGSLKEDVRKKKEENP